MSTAEFSIKLRVYIEDTDAGGIVYYVNYLKFMFNHDLMFVVHEVSVRYHRPARLDDELQVKVQLQAVRGATMILQQDVCRDGELLASAGVTLACVGRSSLQPQRLPRTMLDTLRQAQVH